MTSAESAIAGLKQQRPEWSPWLSVVGATLQEAAGSRWDDAVPDMEAALNGPAPALDGATVVVQAGAVRSLVERLIRLASRDGTPKMATLRGAADAELDMTALFAASLRQDGDRLDALAARAGADAEAFRAVADLVTVPFLHACGRRRASSFDEGWVEPYCPTCGAWPAFAEILGIERSRHYRCGRCGGAWHARLLSCPYCATSDHDRLMSLVPEGAGNHAMIDACRNCLGYVKAFTRLQGCQPASVMLDDLASVDLDLAAVDKGYARPPGAGFTLDVQVVPAARARRFFAWNA